ncbi:FHA domain-containing protein [Streptomyces boncukensis]|uniref:FHA domain-containing protein n=1 Tax=Streptomyces boncukensis TaxID=2711219 RepID=A0A6G4WQW1_9ACTN|nr:FHA domain-containing protein [Streptomyces boncukensis]NGO66881.1 FHA domain-containing protein [Streptomyces boncukensis]
MLWTIASGKRAVGIDVRNCPSLGVHWNIRQEFYHHLGTIDRLMLERYGEDGVPRRGDGRLMRLAECLYHPDWPAGPVAADDVLTGFLGAAGMETRVTGTVLHTEFIDDRWKSGGPHRAITVSDPPTPDTEPDSAKLGGGMADILDGPSTLQARAADVLILLRRYLEEIEAMDLARGLEQPRARLFSHHRVLPGPDGFTTLPDGRRHIRIEAIRELDYAGRFRRVRAPGTDVIDLGVPEVFMIAEGFDSEDAKRLGFQQHDVHVDHQDGRGPVVAQADYLAGLMDVLVDGRLRRRIASAFDAQGTEYWVRQIAVGHEGDPAVGWVLVQVPDFKSFDPVAAGLVPEGTDQDSPEYYAGFQHLMRDFFLEQAGHILEIPKEELLGVQMNYGPKLFSVIEQIGDDALIVPNGVVAGDSFGNGHFMTSGGAMTGMVGHGRRVRDYWRSRAAGRGVPEALRELADGIKADTEDWLQVSAREFSEAAPINFGAERIQRIARASGTDPSARAAAVDAGRRHRHTLVTLDYSDWRRPVMYPGRRYAYPLPPLDPRHPDERTHPADDRAAALPRAS